MELYLQMGYGMMGHAFELISSWSGGTAILSPRDNNPDQLAKLSKKLTGVGGTVLLDPQAYDRAASHTRLIGHPHWPFDDSATNLGESVRRLLDYNAMMSTREVILPSAYTTVVDDSYDAKQLELLAKAREHDSKGRYLSTIALSAPLVQSRASLDRLFDCKFLSQTDGIYLVVEHPQKSYLVRDAPWLVGMLDIVAACRLREKSVVLGYGSHQMLILAASGLNAIATGTWLNVRSFDLSKFYEPDEDDISRRTTWYYSPQAQSEYKIATLQLAFMQGALKPLEYNTQYSAKLFGSVAPQASGYSEQDSFRHYLTALRDGIGQIDMSSFEAQVFQQQKLLGSARSLVAAYAKLGVFDIDRSIRDSIDAHQQALTMHAATRGPVLRRAWSTIA